MRKRPGSLRLCAAFVAALALLGSCTALPQTADQAAPPAEPEQHSFLPLAAGWYLYDFERTFKGIEVEYAFAQSMGVQMIEEITYRQTGTVTYCENGILHDPVLDMELTVDNEGQIRSVTNHTVSGILLESGSFYWTALEDINEGLNHISVRGQLSYLPRMARGGNEFDGVYHLIDPGTGREQIVRIEDGFYTWQYTDGEEAGFTPWPTLILPDGSFSFTMEITTVLAMGDFSRMDYSTGIVTEGQVHSGGSSGNPAGISLQEFSHTAGMGITPSSTTPQIYSGTVLRDGEFPNEAIPKNVETLVRPQVKAAQNAAPFDWARYPPWYRNPPKRAGFIYVTGEKTFPDRNTALALAEAAAAAGIAAQIRVRVTSFTTETTNRAGTGFESQIQAEALEDLAYRVVEQVYQDDAGTAFVLLEFDLGGVE
jgi:hypothetical protein